MKNNNKLEAFCVDFYVKFQFFLLEKRVVVKLDVIFCFSTLFGELRFEEILRE